MPNACGFVVAVTDDDEPLLDELLDDMPRDRSIAATTSSTRRAWLTFRPARSAMYRTGRP